MKLSRVFLEPYKMGSKSAKLLAQSLGIKRIRHGRVVKPGRVVIPWGIPNNKLTFFRTLNGVDGINLPEWTKDQALAEEWVKAGKRVFCRTLLNSCQGKGIVIADKDNPVVPAPLYTVYKKKKKEFRVHIVGDSFYVQEKKKRIGAETNSLIRNHANGYVFCTQNVVLSGCCLEMCVKALSHLGLVYAAFDVIWNEHEDKYYLLEANTAPGIDGSTLEFYKNCFVKLIEAM